MKALGAWVLLLGIVVGQGATATYGTVIGSKVRLRGGPGDAQPILGVLSEGAPLRVVETKDRWLEVEIPGGFPVYITTGKGQRKYYREVTPGEAVITAKDLLLRPSPSKDSDNVGRLQPGDRVLVIGEEGEFTMILAPDKVRAYIYDPNFQASPNQEEARAAFETQHRASRRALLASGARSKIYLEKEEARERYETMVASAFSRFDEESRKAWDQQDLTGVRSALQELQTTLPENHPSRERANRMMATITEWERTNRELAAARAGIKKAKEDAVVASTRYEETLTEIKTRTIARTKAVDAPKGRYLTTGRVGRSVPIGEHLVGRPAHALWHGGKRTFYLESDRYDLSEYEGKLVGLYEAEGPLERTGYGFRVYRVVRMEILERHKDEEKIRGE